MQLQKQQIILITGGVLAVMTMFMVKLYLDQQKVQYIKEARKLAARQIENSMQVYVAKEDIPRGFQFTSENMEQKLEPKTAPRDKVPPTAASAERIVGKTTIGDIPKGNLVVLDDLSMPRRVGELAMVTPVGKRAITIAVDNISSVGGMIQAGDYVDVIAALPVPVQTPDGKQQTQITVMPLFQKVEVLAVGRETIGAVSRPQGRYAGDSAEEKKEGTAGLITLAVSPQEANLVAFVQEQAKIRLVLRSKTDTEVQPFQAANWDTLFQYLIPKKPEEPKKEEVKKEEPKDYVEIYRGLNKERVPLSK